MTEEYSVSGNEWNFGVKFDADTWTLPLKSDVNMGEITSNLRVSVSCILEIMAQSSGEA